MKKIAVVIVMLLLVAAVSYAADPAAGKDLFMANCKMCHGPNADGNTTMGKNFKIRDFRTPEVQKQSDAELTTIITKGKNKMPVFGSKLSADQIANLVAYVRQVGKQR